MLCPSPTVLQFLVRGLLCPVLGCCGLRGCHSTGVLELLLLFFCPPPPTLRVLYCFRKWESPAGQPPFHSRVLHGSSLQTGQQPHENVTVYRWYYFRKGLWVWPTQWGSWGGGSTLALHWSYDSAQDTSKPIGNTQNGCATFIVNEDETQCESRSSMAVNWIPSFLPLLLW